MEMCGVPHSFLKLLPTKISCFFIQPCFFLCHAGLQTDCVVYSDVWILVPVTLVLVGVDDLQLLRLPPAAETWCPEVRAVDPSMEVQLPNNTFHSY